ncbi:hypothetical protein B0P06_004787 [Clostridium saccharoperbutylacetonicum]|uniref:Uncharacterized protein n=1 Tax=Clostridium saccharoperbutylacetonicum N1-4(HMT) TaxID=931276 RepID=M1MKY2_9CLOT|nr:hypothetical protein [Clostridium saccharoperbutylacetonicum]AGF56928.1 hypothetical protein Cspa_c31670 [Clostridium saccharoperbutylacetonicum N1-4(HMT)]NRT62313.1 hypothetical protein [Clostridium saccharoperbutylacetonicum]NSB25650.1 hypothetical protein [Clostridium saccharoperbutylacetonicum]NSB45016.1 hypothetical protein [Clostridium saccharoperbutylacetonicum]
MNENVEKVVDEIVDLLHERIDKLKGKISEVRAMSKRDNVNLVLMTHYKVNLQCDDEKIQCRYLMVRGESYATWWLNGEDTKLQVTALIKMLREKYKSIKVLWKRQY